MNVEIERTWILSNDFIELRQDSTNYQTQGKIPKLTNIQTIKQYHIIKTDDEEIRFRSIINIYDAKINGSYEMTMKLGQGTVRKETNFNIDSDYYDSFLKHKIKDVVEKVVYMYELENNVVMFINSVNGGKLKYVDVEFNNCHNPEEVCKDFNIYEFFNKEDIIEEMDKSKPKEYLPKE